MDLEDWCNDWWTTETKTRIDGEIEGKGLKGNNILMKLEFFRG